MLGSLGTKIKLVLPSESCSLCRRQNRSTNNFASEQVVADTTEGAQLFEVSHGATGGRAQSLRVQGPALELGPQDEQNGQNRSGSRGGAGRGPPLQLEGCGSPAGTSWTEAAAGVRGGGPTLILEGMASITMMLPLVQGGWA